MPELFQEPNDRLIVSDVGIQGPPGPVGPKGGKTLYDVTDAPYNADKTGVVDATSAINTALTDAPAGSTIYFPAGTYKVSGDVNGYIIKVTKKGITLMGENRENTIIRLEDSNGDYVNFISEGSASAIDISGLVVRNLQFDGNSANNPISDVTLSGPLFNGFPRLVVRVSIGDNVIIKDCAVKNHDSVNTFVIFGGTTTNRGFIQRNVFTNIGAGLVHDHSTIYTHGSGFTISDNRFYGGGDAAVAAIECHGSDQKVTNNHVEDYFGIGNLTGVTNTAATVGHYGIVWTGNTSRRLGVGITLWAWDQGNLVGPALKDVVVSENQIEVDYDRWNFVSAFRYGIGLNTSSDGVAHDVKIINNSIEYLPTVEAKVSNDSFSAGIMWARLVTVNEGTSDEDLVISGNTIKNPVSAGVLLVPNIIQDRLRISHNNIVNPAEGVISSVYFTGINCQSTVAWNNCEINNNLISDTRGTGIITSGIDTSLVTVQNNCQSNWNHLRRTDGVATPVNRGHASAGWYCILEKTPYVEQVGFWRIGSKVIDSTASTGGTEYYQTGPSGSVVWNPGRTKTDIFTGNGTWTKPAGAQRVFVTVIGGGGGGGSGRRGAAGTARTGGGGGGAGSLTYAWFDASALGATETITVGTGGAGGAAVTADSTNGNAGSNGVTSSFGGKALASHGTGAQGGTEGVAASGGASFGGSTIGSAGGSSSATGGVGVTGGNGSPPGGCSGGGITSGNAASNGGGQGFPTFTHVGFAAGGVVDGAAPSAGGDVGAGIVSVATRSAGGGAGSITTAAQAGGVGGKYGGGGGGGGASLNGNNSGAGGTGGAGAVMVITYW